MKHRWAPSVMVRDAQWCKRGCGVYRMRRPARGRPGNQWETIYYVDGEETREEPPCREDT